MYDIRQTREYATYMQQIGWHAEWIGHTAVFIKRIPLYGSLAKIQRPSVLPDYAQLKKLRQQYRIQSLLIEPLTQQIPFADKTKSAEPQLGSKTIQIDLTRSEKQLFQHFSEAKRRAVRRTEKYGVTVKISQDINEFIKLKNKTAGILGFLTTHFVKPLWKVFEPLQTAILLAYPKNSQKPFAGIFLIWAKDISYYWTAAATKEGKKQFAPTLLVWETLKYAKAQGNRIFDFEGIYDERFPQTGTHWHGFTKFKQGFGGKEVYFPQPFTLK